MQPATHMELQQTTMKTQKLSPLLLYVLLLSSLPRRITSSEPPRSQAETLIKLNNSPADEPASEAEMDSSSRSTLELQSLEANESRGSFLEAICKLRQLSYLDISDNQFTGKIPDCLGNIPSLTVLNLQGNKFFGSLPSFKNASSLKSLKVGGNKLEGSLPRALANCSELEVLDISNNTITDTFPFWLKKLPALKILVLRRNKFYGQIELLGKEKNIFPELHILDLSFNQFSGSLSKEFARGLKAMFKPSDNNKTGLKYVGENYYYESVTITMKGRDIKLERILIYFTSLDLSNNQFYGEIPEEVNKLQSLKVLNLSSNSFTGQIKPSLADLKDLESLDLSRNKLYGRIPAEFIELTFLSFLNLSYNQLEGLIPQGNQFNTFENSSYVGNSKLCGLPLTKKCREGNDNTTPPPEEERESWSAVIFDWKIVFMGYGCGLVIGFSIGYMTLSQTGHKGSMDKHRTKLGRRFSRSRRLQRVSWST